MKIFIFGNEDLEMDSLPLRLLPKLEEKFPEIDFVVKDPNEDWDMPDDVTIIDTTVGISDVTVFNSLEKFSAVPRVSMHDFDALTNLKYLWKLGKIKSVKIIGVPPNMNETKAFEKILEILEK